jgi:4-diphosphocytidyl-2-C-methyl-D-erythritol kinase
MIVFPNAKINIGLHITGKRSDGYHNIESCFYPVAWSDILEVAKSKNLTVGSTGIPVPGPWKDNLCYKAYRLLQEDHNLPPVDIHLHKILPICAGLGGGSSDGAFALKAFNELFNIGLSDENLEDYSLKLGSDCPFFICNQPTFVTGRGEIFEEIDISLGGKMALLVNPPLHISTAEAYEGIRNYSKPGQLLNDLQRFPIEQWHGLIKNDFEEGLFKKHPELASLKELLYKKGAQYASMTGSGSTIYGIFDQRADTRGWFPADYLVWQGELQF